MDSAPSEWFEEDRFWIASFPFMFPESRFEEAADQVDRILVITGTTSGAVLDLAAGPGRHAVHFAKRGFAVTAVDRSSFLLETARAYAAREGATVEFVLADMREFVRPEAFDLAVSLFTSFGYFDDASENERVLQQVHASLRSGGAFVLDLLGKEMIARRYQDVGASELPGVGLVVQRRDVTDDWSRMDNEWILVRDGTAESFRIRHWIYSAQELKQMLAKVGFADVRVYGSLAGTAYGLDASRLIAVARK